MLALTVRILDHGHGAVQLVQTQNVVDLRAAAGGDEILHYDDLLALFKPALNLVLPAVILRTAADIAHRQAHQMCGDGGAPQIRSKYAAMSKYSSMRTAVASGLDVATISAFPACFSCCSISLIPGYGTFSAQPRSL